MTDPPKVYRPCPVCRKLFEVKRNNPAQTICSRRCSRVKYSREWAATKQARDHAKK